jgi:uncharacterized membrane protein
MQRFATLDGDLVVGTTSGIGAAGPAIPADLAGLPLGQLRFVNGALVNAAGIATFHVDDRGQKHAVAGAGWQALACAWDAQVVRQGGAWRVMTAGEVLAPRIKAECARRILSVASANTQMNMTAAQAAGRFDAADAATYLAALDWVDAMRTRCGDLVAAADVDFAGDGKWPAVPNGVAALAARF